MVAAASGPTGILAGRPSAVCAAGGCHQEFADPEKPKQKKSKTRLTAVKHRHETDLYVRPSWTDAALALDQLEKVSPLTLSLLTLARSTYLYSSEERTVDGAPGLSGRRCHPRASTRAAPAAACIIYTYIPTYMYTHAQHRSRSMVQRH